LQVADLGLPSALTLYFAQAVGTRFGEDRGGAPTAAAPKNPGVIRQRLAIAIKDRLLWVNGAARDVIEAPKLEPWIVRYELSDFEWAAIKPLLPNKSRGVRRVNDRRVLNGIFWVLRSGAPWRDLPVCYGPRTTCYNRFVRWRKAGVWDRIMDSLAAAHDAAVQMIDTSIVRVHQHAACIAKNRSQSMGRSRGGLTSKIHAVVDTNGLPVRLGLTAGEAHDNRLALSLLSRLRSGSMLLGWLRPLRRAAIPAMAQLIIVHVLPGGDMRRHNRKQPVSKEKWFPQHRADCEGDCRLSPRSCSEMTNLNIVPALQQIVYAAGQGEIIRLRRPRQ
jgi:transposase